ncbi:glycoside hydrolase family protein [Luteimonas sp. A534]
MDFRELTQDEYDARLRTVIVGTEGLHERAMDVGDNRATIGWGYTLNRNNNVEIWERSGIELSDAEWDTLRRVDAEPTLSGKTRIGLTLTRELDEGEADSLFRASVQEYEGHAIAAGMPLSDERIALVSVTYNRGVGAMQGHAVLDAIAEGDRAEAWYQMRYNCWGSREDMEGGLRKRRFAESEVFGLYDDRDSVGLEEAADVYRMYQSNREEITRVEAAFGVTLDGDEARSNRIAHANRDYPAIVADYGSVKTLSESLEPARTVLLEHLQQQYPEHAGEFTEARFNAGSIDLERFPVQDAPERADAAGTPGLPGLDTLNAALRDGNSDLLDRIAMTFARSEEGQEMAREGDRLAQRAAEPEQQEQALAQAR